MQTNIIAFEETYGTDQAAELRRIYNKPINGTPPQSTTDSVRHIEDQAKELRKIMRKRQNKQSKKNSSWVQLEFDFSNPKITQESIAPVEARKLKITASDLPELLKSLLEKYFEQTLVLETRYTIKVNKTDESSYSVNLVQGALVTNPAPVISDATIIIDSPDETTKQILDFFNNRQTELDFRESAKGLYIQKPYIKLLPSAQ